ncbi:MAG: hypothetical protein QM650_13425 [Microlunatus sp.]
MDITQFFFTCIAAVGMLVVALLAIVPMLTELLDSRRYDRHHTDRGPIRPVKVRHP